MLDIRLIREDLPLVERAMQLRGIADALGPVVEADERHRRLLREMEDLRARHNQTSKQLGRMKERPPELLEVMRVLGEQIA
jgi:seryl-tRNA synthetase